MLAVIAVHSENDSGKLCGVGVGSERVAWKTQLMVLLAP